MPTPTTLKPKRKRLSTHQRRAELIEMGKGVFSARAYDDVSTEELCRIAGVSTGLLFHYFSSKRRFYVETVRALAAEVAQAVALPPDVPMHQAVPRALAGLLAFVGKNTAVFRAVIQGGIGVDDEVQPMIDDIRAETVRAIALAMGLGTDISPLVQLRLRGWIGFVETTALAWSEQDAVSPESVIDAMMDTLLHQLDGASSAVPELDD